MIPLTSRITSDVTHAGKASLGFASLAGEDSFSVAWLARKRIHRAGRVLLVARNEQPSQATPRDTAVLGISSDEAPGTIVREKRLFRAPHYKLHIFLGHWNSSALARAALSQPVLKELTPMVSSRGWIGRHVW